MADDLSQYEVGDDLSKYEVKPSGTPISSSPAPMRAPSPSDFMPDSGSLPKFISGVGEGIGNMGSGIYNTIRHPIDTLEGAGRTIKNSYDLAKSGQYIPAVATAAGLAGFDEPKMAREWNEGNGAQAVGQALPMAITDAVGAEKAAGRGNLEVAGKPVVPMVRDTVGKVLRTPEGKLRPVVGAGARVAGAAIGNASGIPEGGLIGALTGRSVADALIPKRPFELTPEVYDQARSQMYGDIGTRLMKRPDIAPPEPELGSPENPGWMVKLPNRMPVKQLPPEVPSSGAGEGPIGSNSTERYVQTLMQKPILTPEEQASVERILGPDARMRSGEGLTKWRNRVTGGLKAARPRTE